MHVYEVQYLILNIYVRFFKSSLLMINDMKHLYLVKYRQKLLIIKTNISKIAVYKPEKLFSFKPFLFLRINFILHTTYNPLHWQKYVL